MALINNVQDIIHGNGIYIVGPKTGGSTIIEYSTTTLSKWATTNLSSLLPVDTFISKVTYLNGEFFILANGANVCILKSSDAINWTVLYNVTASNNTLLSIDYGNAVYVACTFGNTLGTGQMLISNDAITWTPVSIPTDKPTFAISPFRIIFDGVKFVAVYGYTPTPQDSSTLCGVLTSTDGSNWNIYQVPYATSGGQVFQRIACDFNSFTSIVWDGSNIYQSNDITTPTSWTIVDTAPSDLGNLKRVNGPFGNSYFILGYDAGSDMGILKTSADGITWISHIYPFYSKLTDVIYDGSTYIVIGDGQIINGYYSNEISTTNNFNEYTTYFAEFYSVTEGNGVYVGVGDYGVIAKSITNGVSWEYISPTVIISDLYKYYWIVVYGNNTFVTIGSSGNIATSTDGGNSWSTQIVGNGADWNGMVFQNSLFVAIGGNSQIATSPDGLIWTLQNLGGLTETLTSIHYQNGIFFVCGNGGTIITSSDGVTWNVATAILNILDSITSVTYGAGKYIATIYATGTQNLLSSTDAVTWEFINTGINSQFLTNGVYGNGKFVICGNGATILVSSDGGISWVSRNPGIIEDINSLKYVDNRFIIYNIFSTVNPVLSSTDGIIWYIETFPFQPNTIYDINFKAPDKYIAVGSGSLIYSKTNGGGPSITPSPTPISLITPTPTPTLTITPTITITPTLTITPTITPTSSALIDGSIIQSTTSVLNVRTDSQVNIEQTPNGFGSSGGVVTEGGPTFNATVTYLSGTFGSQDTIVRITGTDINGPITEDITVTNFTNGTYHSIGLVEFVTITGVTLLQSAGGGDGLYSVGTRFIANAGTSGCYIVEFRGGIATNVSATDPISTYPLGEINNSISYTAMIDRVANTGGRTFTFDSENITLDVGFNHVDGVNTHISPPVTINVSGSGGTTPIVDIGYFWRYCPS